MRRRDKPALIRKWGARFLGSYSKISRLSEVINPSAGDLADNVSEAILGRINIDDLRAINDPITTGQDATAIGQDSRGDCIEKSTTIHHYLL
jgi:hypothetical protein